MGAGAAITVAILASGCSSKHASEPTAPPKVTATPALISAPTPYATSSPPPTLAPRPPPDATATPIATGITVLDSVLNRLVRGSRGAWTSLADVAPMPCDDARPTERPPCGGAAAGTQVLAFYAAGCDPLFVTTQEQAVEVVGKALENRHAGEIYGGVSGGIPDLTDDGYTMTVRRETANVGNFWYLSVDGRIVGIRNSCGGHPALPQRDFTDSGLLYGPCFSGCKIPTPTP